MATEVQSVLFTDMVDSTGLWVRLGPEAADEVRRQHFATLRRAAGHHGGAEVKGLGDGLMLIFPRPSAALQAAVAMQQAVHRQNRELPEAVGLRIGVSAGELVEEDGDYYGEPATEAARLCQLAGSGQILVTAVVRALAGRRASFPFAVVGDLDLKGLPDPVPTVELKWEPADPEGGPVPLPARLAVAVPTLFGRADERRQLWEAFDEARRGHRRIVMVGGEPGIGKTAVTTDLAQRAHAEGAVVCYGRSDKELGLPYQPFVEAFEHLVVHAPEEVVRGHFADHGGELARLVPTLRLRFPDCPAPTQSDADSERYLAFGAARGLLEATSGRVPLVVVLDDLHWADKPTLLLLRFLAGSLTAVPLLVVGTFRTTDIDDTHPLAEVLADLRREPGVTRLELAGLGEPDVRALVASAAGRSIEAADDLRLVSSLTRDTGGNPFFVWEVLRLLAASGDVVQDPDGRWSVSDHLRRAGTPASLREVVSQRVLALGPDAVRILSLAAVVGSDIQVGLLAAVAGVEEERLLELLAEAARASVVTDVMPGPDRFSFVHALVPAILADDLGMARRVRAHQKVAEAIEADGGTRPDRAAALAWHWKEADRSDMALDYARQAGMDALEHLAPDEAVRWLDEALAHQARHRPDDVALRCEILIGLGTAQRLSGDATFRLTLLEASSLAAELDDAATMAAAALANNRGNFSATGAVDAERLAALDAALARVDDPQLAARLYATAAVERTFDASFEELLAMLREAKRRVAGADPATVVAVYNLAVEIARHPSQLAERLEDTAYSLSVARGLGDPAALFWAVGHRMRATFEAGRVDESDRLVEEMQGLASDIGQPSIVWQARYSLAQRLILRGELDEGEQVAEAAFGLATEAGEPDALTYYVSQLNQVLWMRGRAGEAIEPLQQGLAENPGIPAYRGALARALAQAERWEEAEALLASAAAGRFSDHPRDLLWTTGLTLYADAAIALRHRPSAAVLFELLAPYPDQVAYTGTSCEGHLSHYLGALAVVLGEHDRAGSYFETAAAWAEMARAPFMACRTQLRWAELLLVRGRPGDRDRARRLIDEAARAASAHGFPDVARAAAELGAGAS